MEIEGHFTPVCHWRSQQPRRACKSARKELRLSSLTYPHRFAWLYLRAALSRIKFSWRTLPSSMMEVAMMSENLDDLCGTCLGRIRARSNQAQHGDTLRCPQYESGRLLQAMFCWISVQPWKLYSRSSSSRCSDRTGAWVTRGDKDHAPGWVLSSRASMTQNELS